MLKESEIEKTLEIRKAVAFWRAAVRGAKLEEFVDSAGKWRFGSRMRATLGLLALGGGVVDSYLIAPLLPNTPQIDQIDETSMSPYIKVDCLTHSSGSLVGYVVNYQDTEGPLTISTSSGLYSGNGRTTHTTEWKGRDKQTGTIQPHQLIGGVEISLREGWVDNQTRESSLGKVLYKVVIDKDTCAGNRP